jgi:hypothetical protein
LPALALCGAFLGVSMGKLSRLFSYCGRGERNEDVCGTIVIIVYESWGWICCKVSIWQSCLCAELAELVEIRGSLPLITLSKRTKSSVNRKAGSVGNLADYHPILSLPWFVKCLSLYLMAWTSAHTSKLFLPAATVVVHITLPLPQLPHRWLSTFGASCSNVPLGQTSWWRRKHCSARSMGLAV